MDRITNQEKLRWFQRDRFGMFIHWGLYAIPARGEWVRNVEEMSTQDYQPFFEEFDPVDFDPTAWARLARQAGMRYAVLTAKHHDGFCLFDSQYTDYKATNTPAGRDLVREFLDAFRAEGLQVGLYYSLLDWHHPDYPHYGDAHHPMRNNPACSNEGRDFDRYLDYMHAQVEELMTNYGKIDILWFDFSYKPLEGEAWRAGPLLDMVRRHQPHIIIDNRLEGSGDGFGSLLEENPSPYSGDFVCPEQLLPPDGIRDVLGRPVPWEACITMNDHWGYCQGDENYKDAAMLVRKLVECVSKGGNLLLNVGPDARGNIPPQSVQILQEMGRWMHLNGKSIYGCGSAGLPKPENARITRAGNTLYYHFTEPAIGAYALQGVGRDRVRSVRMLATGAEIRLQKGFAVDNYPDTVFVKLGDQPRLPDAIDTVVAVELK